uniref:Uncharacterized protein n=1 Tax=Rhizophora mucronata TaxID=61149 RepID=A0A2P2NG08_RHIMU
MRCWTKLTNKDSSMQRGRGIKSRREGNKELKPLKNMRTLRKCGYSVQKVTKQQIFMAYAIMVDIEFVYRQKGCN